MNFQKRMVAIGFNVKISGVWRFSTKMANGNLSLTAKNYPMSSIFMPLNELIRDSSMDINQVIINCLASEWRNVAASALRDGIEVDLVKFDYLLDVEDCKILAVTYTMDFRFDPKTSAGFFRKRKSH